MSSVVEKNQQRRFGSDDCAICLRPFTKYCGLSQISCHPLCVQRLPQTLKNGNVLRQIRFSTPDDIHIAQKNVAPQKAKIEEGRLVLSASTYSRDQQLQEEVTQQSQPEQLTVDGLCPSSSNILTTLREWTYRWWASVVLPPLLVTARLVIVFVAFFALIALCNVINAPPSPPATMIAAGGGVGTTAPLMGMSARISGVFCYSAVLFIAAYFCLLAIVLLIDLLLDDNNAGDDADNGAAKKGSSSFTHRWWWPRSIVSTVARVVLIGPLIFCTSFPVGIGVAVVTGASIPLTCGMTLVSTFYFFAIWRSEVTDAARLLRELISFFFC